MFSKNALKYRPWSISKLSVAENCSLKFFLKYIKKQREPAIKDARGRIGQAAHQALELSVQGMDLSRAIKKSIIDCRLTTPEADDLLAYRPNIIGFLDRFKSYKNRNPYHTEYIEHRIGITTDMKSTDFWNNDGIFRLVIDLGLNLKSGPQIIIDHKSGDRTTVKKYSDQLNAYAVASKIINPNITGVQSAVHFLQTGDIDWNQFITSETIEKELTPWLIEKINKGTEELPTEATTATPTEGWWCTFCGYKKNCPAWNG